MSKRRRVGIRTDKFYQSWSFKVEQTEVSTEEEFAIRTPRPVQAPPAGRFYAIEIHSIEYFIPYHSKSSQSTEVLVSITTSPKEGREPFITHAGDPENIFWYEQRNYGDHTPSAGIPPTQTQITNRIDCTDALGHGRLLVGDNIYVQVSSNTFVETEVIAGFKISYTYTTVGCLDYVQELTAQVTSSTN